MEIAELKAKARERRGKSHARKLRAGGAVPAVLYGPKIGSKPLTVDLREFSTLTRSEAGSNVIVNLAIEGEPDSHTAIVKEIQKDPTRDSLLHVDFMEIAMDEAITAMVPVVVVGESAGVKEGGVLQHTLWEVEVAALPKDLPEHLEIDVSELEIGDSLRVSDLAVPDGVTVTTAGEEILLSIVPPTVVKEEVAAEEEVAEEEVAEGEVSAAEPEALEEGEKPKETPSE